MKRITPVAVLLVGGMLLAGAAQAVDPVAYGPMGNPEEPAMRPYKAIVKGILALGFQTQKAFVDGNTKKMPIWGSAYTFEGVRKGSIELGTRTFWGITGSQPRPIKKLGHANLTIDSDPLLRHAADATAAVGVGAAFGGARTGAATATTALSITKVVDREPAQEFHKTAVKIHNKLVPKKHEVSEAQKKYLPKQRVHDDQTRSGGKSPNFARTAK